MTDNTPGTQVPDKHLDVLEVLVENVSGDWAVTGSTGMALQGMDLDVNDLDIQSNGPAADRLAEFLRREGHVLETLRSVESKKMSSRLGSYELIGVKIEVIGDLQKKVDGSWGKTVDVTENLKNVRVESRSITVPVLRLEYEEQAYRKMGREERADAVRSFLSR
jgi:hypothetical protein|nr:MAG: hypothetical protein J07AB56_11770 [Candidatus Nanosalinarum sp. J07AB56]